MTSSAIDLLRCPVCGAPGALCEDGRVYRCNGEKPHSFDRSRSGYLNLSRAQKGGGDDVGMVRARSAFLEKGYYKPLSDRVCAILDEAGAKTVIDAGCGEGYYSNRMAAGGRTVVGADLSKAAVEHAAKQAKRLGNGALFLVASLFALPIADGSVDAVVNLFAPCAEPEFCRVLRPGGLLVVVGAGASHLMGLKRAVYREPYPNRARADLPRGMRPVCEEHLTGRITVSGRDDIAALFAMTPYAFRTSPADRAKLDALDRLETETEFDIFCYRKEKTE